MYRQIGIRVKKSGIDTEERESLQFVGVAGYRVFRATGHDSRRAKRRDKIKLREAKLNGFE